MTLDLEGGIALLNGLLAALNPENDPRTLFLALARVAPVAALAPWLAFPGVPVVVRGAIAATLAWVFALAVKPVQPADAELLFCILGELALGAVFALAASVPFLALQFGGSLSDRWRATLVDDGPGWSFRNGLPQLFVLFGVALFWSSGGVNLASELLRLAFDAVPLAAPPTDVAALARGAIRMTAMALGFGLALATPLATALILFDTLAFIGGRGVDPLPPLQVKGLRSLVGLWGTFLTIAVLAGDFPSIATESFRIALMVISDGFR